MKVKTVEGFINELRERAEKAERERDGWQESARHFANGQEFYQGIVRQIGSLFGDAARTSDDGSVQDNVLALKVPELVAALAAHVERARRLADNDRADDEFYDEDGDLRTGSGWKSKLGRDLHAALKSTPAASPAAHDAALRAKHWREAIDWVYQEGMQEDLHVAVLHHIDAIERGES